MSGEARARKGAVTNRQLHQIATEFRAGILNGRDSWGMCAVVCYPLEGFLSFLGVESRAVELTVTSEDQRLPANHVLLRLADGRILDPTADQFGLEPVYVGPMPKLYAEIMATA